MVLKNFTELEERIWLKEPFHPESVRKNYYRSKGTRNQRPISLSESYQTAPLIDELGVQISILREGHLINKRKRNQVKDS